MIHFVERTTASGKQTAKPALYRGGELQVLVPECWRALLVVERVWEQRNYGPVLVTSALDGTHSHKSAHYSGRAFDVRIWSIPQDEREGVARAIRNQLPSGYDVVYGPGHDTHFHIEWDPKGPAEDEVQRAGVMA